MNSKFLKIGSSLILIVSIYGCNKSTLSSGGPMSSVTVVNTVSNTSGLVTVFGSGNVQWFASAQMIPIGAAAEYSVPSGTVPLAISDISDTTAAIYTGTFEFKPQAIYSIFLAGQYNLNSHSVVDTLLTQDFPPSYSVSDSVTGVRFVNIVEGGDPISINLTGNAFGSEIQNLPFKGASSFKPYSANSSAQGYTFEVRDGNTDSLLATYSYGNLELFKNVTLVCYGSFNGASGGAVNCFLENNY